MKKFCLVFVFLLLAMLSLSQEECKDIIYTSQQGDIIFDCCIEEVKRGNIVYYSKEGVLDSIAAIAITRNGQYIDLLKFTNKLEEKDSILRINDVPMENKDYDYYQREYERASLQKGIGVSLTIVGVFLELSGLALGGLNNPLDVGTSQQKKNAGTVLFLTGAVMEVTGIPLWISGGIKRSRNKAKMEEIKGQTSLTFGATPHGVGIRMRF